MTVNDFEVGEKVVVGEFKLSNTTYKNEKAIVIKVDLTQKVIGLEFDNCVYGHDCLGEGKSGHCWWFSEDDIEHNLNEIKKLEENKMDLSKLNRDYVWMEVSEDKERWFKRAVISFTNGKYEVINNAEDETSEGFLCFMCGGKYGTSMWKYAREIKEPTYKPYTEMTDELARELLGKRVRSKEKLYDKCYGYYIINGVESDTLFIGSEWFELKIAFEYYVFEDSLLRKNTSGNSFKFDRDKINFLLVDYNLRIPVSQKQIDFEMVHLNKKRLARGLPIVTEVILHLCFI